MLDGPESVHLAPWPETPEADRELLDEVADVRRVVTLAHQARAAAELKLRQPVRRLVVEGAARAVAHADEIADEVRVKEVVFDRVDAELRVKPNLPVLGPKLGKDLRAVQAALAAGEFEELGGGRFRVAGHDLEPDEVLVERGGRDGLGGRGGGRRHGRARHRARRRAAARGPRLRPDPRGERDCARTRASRSPTASC